MNDDLRDRLVLEASREFRDAVDRHRAAIASVESARRRVVELERLVQEANAAVSEASSRLRSLAAGDDAEMSITSRVRDV